MLLDSSTNEHKISKAIRAAEPGTWSCANALEVNHGGAVCVAVVLSRGERRAGVRGAALSTGVG